MKYQKDFKKVSFGFGNEKVAGKGSLAEQHDPPEQNVDDKTALLTIILQVLVGVVAIAIKIFIGKKFFDKATKKKNKKEKKKAKKLEKKGG